MQVLGLNVAADLLAVFNSVHWLGDVLRKGERSLG